MQSRTLNESSCGIHGCQQVTITHKGGGDMKASTRVVASELSVDIERLDGNLSATTSNLCRCDVSINRIEKKVNASLSLVCRTSQGSWEYLLVREGEIMLIDGQRVIVKRK